MLVSIRNIVRQHRWYIVVPIVVVLFLMIVALVFLAIAVPHMPFIYPTV